MMKIKQSVMLKGAFDGRAMVIKYICKHKCKLFSKLLVVYCTSGHNALKIHIWSLRHLCIKILFTNECTLY
jgi:hypothetical protein